MISCFLCGWAKLQLPFCYHYIVAIWSNSEYMFTAVIVYYVILPIVFQRHRSLTSASIKMGKGTLEQHLSLTSDIVKDINHYKWSFVIPLYFAVHQQCDILPSTIVGIEINPCSYHSSFHSCYLTKNQPFVVKRMAFTVHFICSVALNGTFWLGQTLMEKMTTSTHSKCWNQR